MWPRHLACLLVTACGRLGFDPVGDTSFAAICGFERLTVITSSDPSDDQAAATLPAPIADGCERDLPVRTVSQDDAGILDPDGRPLLARDDLGVVVGGLPQRALRYLSQALSTAR